MWLHRRSGVIRALRDAACDACGGRGCAFRVHAARPAKLRRLDNDTPDGWGPLTLEPAYPCQECNERGTCVCTTFYGKTELDDHFVEFFDYGDDFWKKIVHEEFWNWRPHPPMV